MRQVLFAAVVTAAALLGGPVHAEEPVVAPSAEPARAPVARKAAPRVRVPAPGPWWVSLGGNLAHVEDSEKNCPGLQGAIAFGRRVFVKLERSVSSYEENDSTDTCDGLVVGDSDITDKSVLIGAVSWNSGLFFALGPSRAKVAEDFPAQRAEDTGHRVELGWSSRHARRSRGAGGIEVTLFAANNDLHHVHGLAISATLGPGR